MACWLYYDKAVEVVVNGNMEDRNCQCVVEELRRYYKNAAVALGRTEKTTRQEEKQKFSLYCQRNPSSICENLQKIKST